LITVSPLSTFFPYTTLFRSFLCLAGRHGVSLTIGGAHNVRAYANYVKRTGVPRSIRVIGGVPVASVHDEERLLLSIAEVWVAPEDRKSTRLNSSHLGISYAV